jgi:transposase-like protein
MTQSTVKSSNGVAPPPVSSPPANGATEVLPKARRRTFSAGYKQQILQAADACRQSGSGQLGSLLRREGLHSSHLTTWRRQRDRGELGSKKRGKKSHPQAKEVARLQRQNERLQAQLTQAETIISVQKKLCTLFGLPAADSPKADSK